MSASTSTLRELTDCVVAAASGDELLHQCGVHNGATGCDPADRLRELGHVSDPALEQITGALADGQQLHRLLDLSVRGQDEDGGCWEVLANLPKA
jgi:hypothetical protein